MQCQSPPTRESSYLQSVRVVAGRRSTGVVSMNDSCWWRSWRRLVLWGLFTRFGRSSRGFRTPLRRVDLACSSRRFIIWWLAIGVVHRRWHWVHSILATRLRVVGIEDVWILIRRIVSCSLFSVQKPLHDVSTQSCPF